jgi:hypothetical protein
LRHETGNPPVFSAPWHGKTTAVQGYASSTAKSMKLIWPAKQQSGLHFWRCSLLLFFLIFAVPGSRAGELLQPPLQERDCAKCHALQVKMLTWDGGKHATEVGCLDCHPQHPPEKDNTVAACDSCHQGRPHYTVEDCLQCHADPHRPLVTLCDPAKPARTACLSCHAEVGKQMEAAAGLHAKLFCTRCHERHGSMPGCLDCHQPHLRSQPPAACMICHPPHRPQQVKTVSWVPTSYCTACHSKAGRELEQSMTNHGVLECVFCHKGPHRSTPSCRQCHGLPHDQALHSQYRGCLSDCHGNAHRLISH